MRPRLESLRRERCAARFALKDLRRKFLRREISGGRIPVAEFHGQLGSVILPSAIDALAGDRLLDSQATPAPGPTPADTLDQEWAPPRQLKMATSRLAMFLIVLGIASFWNGILSIFVVSFYSKADWEWAMLLPILFMSPFLLIGLLLLFGVAYLFLAMFNPTVKIALSQGAVPLGGEVDLAWELEGRVGRIQELVIEVHAAQEVEYMQGTSTITDTETFELVEVIRTSDPQVMRFGSCLVRIPVESMHTFEAEHNKILWTVEVRGQIPWSPDINETYPFRVTPGTAPGSLGAN